jgi:hypothetical protein
MSRSVLAASLLAVLVLVALAAPRAAAEPATGARWVLTLEHGPLKIVAVPQPGGGTKTYHYITLKVTNATGLPRNWYPLVKALTDTGKETIAAGYGDALQAVRDQEHDRDLVLVETTAGKVEPGKTLDTVAVFGPLDPLYDHVKIHVYGLADPIAIYKVDKYPTGVVIQDTAYMARNQAFLEALKEAGGELPKPTVEYQEVSERRVYEMRYERLGDEFRPDDDVITHQSEGWTIVGDPKVLRVIEM